MTDKQSAEPHSQYPHIPAKAKTKPDTKCNGCPMASKHPTCGSFGPGDPLVPEEQFDASQVAKWQWQTQRRQIDADGVPGAYNETYADYWKYLNARGSYNYADAASYKVDSVSGKTLTLKTLDGSDAGTTLLYTWRQRDPSGLKWVNGYQRSGCVMPGDVVQLSGNSIISYTCWPVVTRIVSCAGDTLIVETDKAASAALLTYDLWDEATQEWLEDESDVTCKVWQHAGNPPTWREVIKPDYFFGQQQKKTFSAGATPTDGVIQLASTAVMHPGGFDPLHPTWTFEGQRIDTQLWENVPQADDRLFCLPDKAWVVFKTAKPPEGKASLTLTDDLTTIYSSFRITYFVKTEINSSSCSIVGYARCRWSVPDPTGSGYAGDGVGNGYMCLKRRYDHHSDPYDSDSDGIQDKVDHTLKTPSGLPNYPDNGHCTQHGCCDMWEPAENAETLRPFDMAQDAGRALRELWGSCNQAKVRLYPRDPSPGARQLWRVGHPSLMWHAGYVGLQGPNIINMGEQYFEEWRGAGLWAPPYRDSSGQIGFADGDNRYLRTVQGGIDGWLSDLPTDDFAGAYASTTPQRDPLDKANASFVQRELPRAAPCVERGTGELQNYRGVSNAPVAVPAQDIILPNFSTILTTTQHCANGSFTKKAGEPSVVKLIPLRQEQKAAVHLANRAAHSVTPQSGGKVKIELENGTHIHSQISLPTNPGSADNFDKMHTYAAGGAWPTLPKDSKRVNSHYEPHKYAGSRAAGAWRGDAIGVGDRRFIIDSVQAHDGSEASNYGDTSYIKHTYQSGGVWRASEANATIDGIVRDITITSVKEGSTALERIDAIDRPSTIPAGTHWARGNAVYASAADAGKWLEVKYTVDDGDAGVADPEFTEYFPVVGTWSLVTSMSTDDWDGAATKTITADDVALTITAGTPTSGQVKVDTTSGYLILTGHPDQADRAIEIALSFNIEADPAQDHYSLSGDYTNYARKRDVIIAYDDPDGYLASLEAGDGIDFYHSDGVMLPGATLEWTAYGTDAWAPVACDVHHGTGEFLIPETWFDGKPEFVCFKLKGVQWMDHRGIFPAELWNATQAGIDSLEWLSSGMSSGRTGSISMSVMSTRSESFTSEHPENSCEPKLIPLTGETETYPDWYPGKYLSIDNIGDGDAQSGGASPEAAMGIESDGIGSPACLRFPHDEMEILDAAIEISSSGLTATTASYTYTWNDEEETFDQSGGEEVTVSDIDYIVLGFTGPNSCEPIGQLHGAANGTQIASGPEVVALIKAMRAARGTGRHSWGYGVCFYPTGMSAELGAGVEGLIPGRPPSSTFTERDIGSCGFRMTHSYFTNHTKYNLRWGSATISRVMLRVKYPSEEKERIIPWMRWAPMPS